MNPLSAFSSTMEVINAQVPVDEYWFRNDVLDSLESNLQEGMITQEEYDWYLQEIESYGTIVNEP